jgi:hypothetical protein
MEAQALLDRFGVESAEQLRVEACAERLGLELVVSQLDGAQAQLVVGPEGAHIVLSKELTDRVERRWAIGHELGHFVLEHRAAPAAELCVPYSEHRGRYHHRRQEEEADRFALTFLMPGDDLAAVCDVRPMTLDAPAQLARACSVPLLAAAIRITEVTFRICAAVLSVDGAIRYVSPSLRFLALYDRALMAGKRLGTASLAGQFFDTGELVAAPQLVPAAAWLDGCADGAQLQEHSMVLRDSGAVLTMLWTPNEPAVPRAAGQTLASIARARDHVLGELRAEPIELGQLRELAP